MSDHILLAVIAVSNVIVVALLLSITSFMLAMKMAEQYDSCGADSH